MMKRYGLWIAVPALSCLLFLGFALLRPAPVKAQQFPLLDKVADKVVLKYQQSSCEQLWEKKAHPAPPSEQEQKAIQLLKTDPQMRAEFIHRVAAPIANKMFECGLIP